MSTTTRAARSAATLAVLGAIMLIWVVWGYAQASKPFPGKAEVPTCVDTTVPAGTRVRPPEVTVSVLNAGRRAGLARRTMSLFTDAGFADGDSANAPEGTDVAIAQIWTDDVDSPAVRLVASKIEGAEVVEQSSTAAGVTVVVGDGFQELKAGRKGVKSKTDAVVCGPSTG